MDTIARAIITTLYCAAFVGGSLVLLSSLGGCGAAGIAPATAITQAGGQGYVKGIVYGVPFEVEVGIEVINDGADDAAICPWVYLEVLGVKAHGTLPIEGIDARCFEEIPSLSFGAPTYGGRRGQD